jgi:hemin uptake protein HemP
MFHKPENRPFAAFSGTAEQAANRTSFAPAAPPPTRRISTDRLMAGRREIVLQHGLQEYRLRITAAGKLILTK